MISIFKYSEVESFLICNSILSHNWLWWFIQLGMVTLYSLQLIVSIESIKLSVVFRNVGNWNFSFMCHINYIGSLRKRWKILFLLPLKILSGFHVSVWERNKKIYINRGYKPFKLVRKLWCIVLIDTLLVENNGAYTLLCVIHIV